MIFLIPKPRWYNLETDEEGYTTVWHLGVIIAVIDPDGQIEARRAGVPVYLIAYFLEQPSPEEIMWN